MNNLRNVNRQNRASQEVTDLVPRKKSSTLIATGNEVATTRLKLSVLVTSGSDVVTYSTEMATLCSGSLNQSGQQYEYVCRLTMKW